MSQDRMGFGGGSAVGRAGGRTGEDPMQSLEGALHVAWRYCWIRRQR